MAYQAIPFHSFGGGLNLRDKADAVSEEECIDAMNVRFTTRGAVEQRPGFTTFTGSALTNAPASMEAFYKTDGTAQVVAGCGTRLEALSTNGTIVASLTGLTSSIWDFARIGVMTGATEYLYAGNGNDTLRRWDGAAWTSPGAGMPKGRCLAVMAVDQGNRLVCGGFDTTTGGPAAAATNPSTVWFSDPGAPETWGANNYVHFSPNDGEKVQAIVAWRELVFIFKESRFFVVFGTTVDAAGNPVFNYRTIDANAGTTGPRAAIAAPDGVYFVDRKGLFRTTGGEPELLSSNVDPLFQSDNFSYYSSYFTGGSAIAQDQTTNLSLGYHDHQLFLSYTQASGSVNTRTLVYDSRYQWWSLYDWPAAHVISFRRSAGVPELLFADTSGTKKIMRSDNSQTNDNTTAITSLWRSGWFDYGLPERKTIRESKIWGTQQSNAGSGGGITFNTATDFATGFGANSTILSNTFSQAIPFADTSRVARQGVVFSTRFRNAVKDQTWSVHRLEHHLRESMVPSITAKIGG